MTLRFVWWVLLITLCLILVVTYQDLFSVRSAPEECSPFVQEQLGQAFKNQVLFVATLVATAAGLLYQKMLRYQVFFPGTDAKRAITAAIGGTLVGVVLNKLSLNSATECLQTALKPGSPILDSVV